MNKVTKFLMLLITVVAMAACATPPPPKPPTPTAEDHFKWGVALFKGGNFDGAINELKMATTMKPNYTEAYYYLGQTFEKKNMYDQAERAYRDCIGSDQRYIQAHEALGLMLYRLNKFPEAKPELELAVNLNSVNPEVYTNLGYIYLTNRQCIKARQMFTKALSINSSFYPAKNGLKQAQAFCRKGNRNQKVKVRKTFQGGGKAIDPGNF